MKLFLGILALLSLSLGVYIYADIATQPASVITTTFPVEDVEVPVATITRTNSGYVPQELAIDKGTIVVFKNDSSKLHWPASDYHPTHELYPGFDAKRALGPGEEWRFQFDEPGEWPFHDHVKSQVGGKIYVEDPDESSFMLNDGQVMDEVIEEVVE